jgi:hypothetical protein
MKEIANFFTKSITKNKKGSYFNNSHNDLQYVTSLPDKDKIQKESNHLNDSGFSDLCFEESFDVNNISNSQDEDKKKGNLLTSSGNNPQSQQVNSLNSHVFNSHTHSHSHNRGNTISNYSNLKPSGIKITQKNEVTSHINTINEQSTNTVKHKDDNTSTILKNSTQKSNNNNKKSNQGLSALSGSNSHNNINSLNFNNIGTTIGIINQTSTKRSNFSNNNYLISKAKQSVDGNKGFK